MGLLTIQDGNILYVLLINDGWLLMMLLKSASNDGDIVGIELINDAWPMR